MAHKVFIRILPLEIIKNINIFIYDFTYIDKTKPRHSKIMDKRIHFWKNYNFYRAPPPLYTNDIVQEDFYSYYLNIIRSTEGFESITSKERLYEEQVNTLTVTFLLFFENLTQKCKPGRRCFDVKQFNRMLECVSLKEKYNNNKYLNGLIDCF